MSKFRVELDCAFDKEDDAIAFLNLLGDIQGKIYKGKDNDEIVAVSTCRYHECFHDDIPPKPCGQPPYGEYVVYDLKKTMKKVKNKKGETIESSELLK